MSPAFTILAGVITGAALSAMTRRNLVHAALWLAVCFVGIAGLYLHLGAEFVGFSQILVYVGAVSMVIVFAILLTRGTEPTPQPIAQGRVLGLTVSVGLLAVLIWTLSRTTALPTQATPSPAAAVKGIGKRLVGDDVVPLQTLGLLLTAATLGATVLALRESRP